MGLVNSGVGANPTVFTIFEAFFQQHTFNLTANRQTQLLAATLKGDNTLRPIIQSFNLADFTNFDRTYNANKRNHSNSAHPASKLNTMMQ